jgi:hypothetical protein
MEMIKVLVDILVELQTGDQYDAARIVGIRLKDEIYKLSIPKEKTNEVQSLQPEQA